MANKERNKRAARKARQAKRQEVEAQQAVQAAAAGDQGADKKAVVKKAEKKPEKKDGLVARTGAYFGDVRSELRRVVWPSRADLKSYTIAVIVMLVVFGLAVWLVDTGVVAALVGYSGLRG